MENESFKTKLMKFFTPKNIGLTTVCIACPVIGIVYGTTVLIKKNLDNKNKDNKNKKEENDETEKLKSE
jgi:hypothetical protein